MLTTRTDQVVKACEVKIRELETVWSVYCSILKCDVREVFCVSMTIPQGSDLHRECLGYREKMRAALAAYQVSA